MKKRKIGIVVFVAVLLVIVPLLGGCKAEVAPTPPPPVVEGTVKIAFSMDFTGPYSSICAVSVKGCEDVVRLVNEEGIRYTDPKTGAEGLVRIEYKTLDMGMQIPNCMENYKLFKDWGAIAIRNEWTSETEALLPTAAKDKIVLFGNAASKAAGVPPSWYFGHHKAWGDEVGGIVGWIKENPKDTARPARVGYLGVDTGLGHAAIPYGPKYAAEIGVDWVGTEMVSQTATDYTIPLLRLKDAGADYIILMTGGAPTVVAIKSAYGLGFGQESPPELIGTAASSVKIPLKMAGEAAIGFRPFCFCNQFELDSPKMRELKAAQLKYRGEVLASTDYLLGWRSTAVIIEGIRIALNNEGYPVTGDSLYRAMETIKNFDSGILPTISYSPDDHWGSHKTQLHQVKVNPEDPEDIIMVPIGDWMDCPRLVGNPKYDE